MSLSNRFTALDMEDPDYEGFDGHRAARYSSRPVAAGPSYDRLAAGSGYDRPAAAGPSYDRRAAGSDARPSGKLDPDYAEFLEFKRQREEEERSRNAAWEQVWRPRMSRRPEEPTQLRSRAPEPLDVRMLRRTPPGAPLRGEPRDGAAGLARRAPDPAAAHMDSVPMSVAQHSYIAQQNRLAQGPAATVSSLIPETITIPWAALTPCMPGLHIRTVPDFADCEHIAAALLLHWGVPASVTVYRRVELAYAETGHPVLDRFGRPVLRHRWRRVDYDADGEPRRVVLSAMTGYPGTGNRENRSLPYAVERRLAAAFLARMLQPKPKPVEQGAVEIDEGAPRSAPAALPAAAPVPTGNAFGALDDRREDDEQDGAQDAEQDDKQPAGAAAAAAGAATEAQGAELDDDADEADDADDEISLDDMPQFAWGTARLTVDNVTSIPIGRNFAIARMSKWYPHTEGVRYEILQDRRVQLQAEGNESDRPDQRPWSFYMVGLGMNIRMD